MILNSRTFTIWLFLCCIGLLGHAAEPDRGVKLEYYEPAHYPGVARIANIEGSAQVMVHVGSLGQVSSVRLINSSNHIFRKSAILAAWCSKFSPAIIEGSATEDSMQLDYVFRLNSEQRGNKKQLYFENREQLIELTDNQVCLYGNWLSDYAYVRLSEDRVYVGGIRVHPDIPNFNDSHAEWGFPEVIKKTLISECRMQERELALRGLKLEAIRNETLEMLKGLRIIESSTLRMPGQIRAETIRGDTLEFELPDPFDEAQYFSLQPQSSPAEGAYYSWLLALHPGFGQHLVIHTFQIRTSMSLKNQTAIEIRSFLESAEPNQWGGVDWPVGLGGLLSDMENVLVKPMVVKRL